MNSVSLAASSLSAPRAETQLTLFGRTGLFVWGASLDRHGPMSPVRKVFVIGKTLADPLRVSAAGTAQAEVDVELDEGWQKFGSLAPEPLAALRVPKEPAWDPWLALAELMVLESGAQALRSVWRRLDRAGMSLAIDELQDVATAFVNTQLLAALRSFDATRGEGHEGAWLVTVLYRFALRHALISRKLAHSLELLLELPDGAPSAEEVRSGMEQEEARRKLPASLARLPRLQRQALSLYFGLEGPEHAIKDLAQALGTNPYFARLALTRGLMALAGDLGAQGLLAGEELALVRALLIDVEDSAAAARRLGIQPTALKEKLAAITARVRGVLRPRTARFRSNKES